MSAQKSAERIRRNVLAGISCGPTTTVLVRETTLSRYAARIQCQCRNRFQQISVNFPAAATRAIFAPARFRIRV
jgi:hypothetical protein